jgi:hypothetical protein
VGIVTLTLSAAYAAGDGDLVDLLLVTGGVVLLPAWLVWSGDFFVERSRWSAKA